MSNADHSASRRVHPILSIARHEFLTNVRRKGFVIMTAIVPLIMVVILLVASVFGGQAGAFFEAQFNRDGGATGVVDQYGAFTPLLPEYEGRYILYPDDNVGREAVRAGKVTLLMVISEDYLASGEVTLMSAEGGASAVMSGDSDGGRAFLVDHLLREVVDEDLRRRLVEPIVPVFVPLDAEAAPRGGVAGAVASVLVPYFLGLLLIMTLLTSSGYLLRSVAEEKTSRIIEIILSSVTTQQLLAGKVLGLGAVGLLQVFIWLASAMALSGGFATELGVAGLLLTEPATLALAVTYYLLGYMVFAVLMGAAGAMGTSAQESQQVAGLFSFMAALPLMMGGFMISNPNMIVARILSWFPITAPIAMLMRIGMTRVPPIDIVISIVVLLATIPLVLWAGAKVFRMGLLMYGKRLTFGEAVQALKRA
ncbi:MAG TPA: ABC transporter permease [Chloroflexi bacterium]|nr:ABC transporter permease [Chloroflexota bacterium]